MNFMLEAQRFPDGFFTSITWLSETGEASWRYIEFSIRKSYISKGAYSGRRLNPTATTVIGWPSAVTVNELGDGAAKLPLASTRFHWDTGAGSGCLVLMSFSSR